MYTPQKPPPQTKILAVFLNTQTTYLALLTDRGDKLFWTLSRNLWELREVLQENARLLRHVQEPQLMANMEVLRKAGAGKGNS